MEVNDRDPIVLLKTEEVDSIPLDSEAILLLKETDTRGAEVDSMPLISKVPLIVEGTDKREVNIVPLVSEAPFSLKEADVKGAGVDISLLVSEATLLLRGAEEVGVEGTKLVSDASLLLTEADETVADIVPLGSKLPTPVDGVSVVSTDSVWLKLLIVLVSAADKEGSKLPLPMLDWIVDWEPMLLEVDRDSVPTLGGKVDGPESALDDPSKLSDVDVSNDSVEISVEVDKLPETALLMGWMPLPVPDGSDDDMMELKSIREETVIDAPAVD